MYYLHLIAINVVIFYRSKRLTPKYFVKTATHPIQKIPRDTVSHFETTVRAVWFRDTIRVT